MNTAVFFALFVRSGFPKMDLSWIRYLFPLAHRSFRIVVSGFVFLDLMLDIILLLFSTLILSGTDHNMTSCHLYFSPTYIIRSINGSLLWHTSYRTMKNVMNSITLVEDKVQCIYPKLIHFTDSHIPTIT